MKSVPEPVKRELCARFGGETSSLKFLGGGQDWSDGVVFTFAPAASPAPKTMVLKILEFKADDARSLAIAEDKVRLVRAFGEQGARIVLPEASLNGSIFETLECGQSTFMAYVYAMVRGKTVEKGDRIAHSSAYYRAMGDTLGRLHVVSEARSETLFPDGTSDAGGTISGWRPEWEFFRSWCRDDEVGAAWERIRDELARLPVDKAGYGFVHNDAHVWNLIFDPNSEALRSGREPELTVIDFDCSNYHWYMADSAIALYSTLVLGGGGFETESGPPEGFRQKVFAAFWEGYRRHREPGAGWMDRLDLFLQFRRCESFMPFQEQTARHPAWRSRWKRRILDENNRLFGAG
jgi:Ser/Thr protein kinase RdoA (MazF antagonist)